MGVVEWGESNLKGGIICQNFLITNLQTLQLIKILVENLQNKQPETSKNNWLEDTFRIMDLNPVSSTGKKWTREDLYER